MEILEGVLHSLPDDMKSALMAHEQALKNWNSLTPIQRNEWICWVTIVKKAETRSEHIKRMLSDLLAGKRQPCCWPGCPHRRPSASKYFRKIENL